MIFAEDVESILGPKVRPEGYVDESAEADEKEVEQEQKTENNE